MDTTIVFISFLLRLACPSKWGRDNRVDGGQGWVDKWKRGCSEEHPTFDGAAASSREIEDPSVHLLLVLGVRSIVPD